MTLNRMLRMRRKSSRMMRITMINKKKEEITKKILLTMLLKHIKNKSKQLATNSRTESMIILMMGNSMKEYTRER